MTALLPNLPPDIGFEILARDELSERWSFEIKRVAMGPYIEQRWGWDEALQGRLHAARFAAKPLFRVMVEGRPVGTLSWMREGSHRRFGEFYLLPEIQKRGVGGRILRHCLSLADAERLPVRLEYLKWNPVGSLYKRHGFTVIGETDIHFLMERPAVAQ